MLSSLPPSQLSFSGFVAPSSLTWRALKVLGHIQTRGLFSSCLPQYLLLLFPVSETTYNRPRFFSASLAPFPPLNERRKAMDVRDATMNTWAKSKCVVDSDGEECAKEKQRRRRRKGGSDALKFLEAKCQADAEVKKEVALRQRELALTAAVREI